MPKVCVVGSSNTDLLTKVKRLPKLGETSIGQNFHIGFGGKGGNQAIMAAKLKSNVTMVTKLGKDIFGNETLKNYKDNDINTNFVYFCENSSGVAPIFVDEDGNNFIVIVPGANWELKPDDIIAAKNEIENSDCLVCQLEIPLETTFEALKIARDAGVTTIFNPAPARDIPDDIYKITDIIIPNEVEASYLTGIEIKSVNDAKKACKVLLEKKCRSVIITLGKLGSVVADNINIIHIKPIKVKAIDTTGAGDAFIGSFAHYYGVTGSIEKSAEFANVAASLSVCRIGTQTSFPSLKDILLKEEK